MPIVRSALKGRAGVAGRPIACALNAVQMGRRAARWQSVLSKTVIAVNESKGGYVLSLDPQEPAFAEITELIEAERVCCPWMTMKLEGGDQATLSVTAESAE